MESVDKRDGWQEVIIEVLPLKEVWGDEYWKQVKDYAAGQSRTHPGRALTHGPDASFFGQCGRAFDLPWKRKGRGNRHGE